MGDRYFLTVVCPECKAVNEDVYYAPTCDFLTHTCESCGHEIDLEEYTGISYEQASSLSIIERIVENGQENLQGKTRS